MSSLKEAGGKNHFWSEELLPEWTARLTKSGQRFTRQFGRPIEQPPPGLFVVRAQLQPWTAFGSSTSTECGPLFSFLPSVYWALLSPLPEPQRRVRRRQRRTAVLRWCQRTRAASSVTGGFYVSGARLRAPPPPHAQEKPLSPRTRSRIFTAARGHERR